MAEDYSIRYDFSTKMSEKYKELIDVRGAEVEDIVGHLDEHYDPDIYEFEDILEEIDYKELDLEKSMMYSIIDNLEMTLATNLKKNKVCIFPYIGRGKINKALLNYKRASKDFKELREALGPEAYRYFRDNIMDFVYDEERTDNDERSILMYLRRTYKEEIERWTFQFGENYVSLFLTTMQWFKPIKHNREEQYDIDIITGARDKYGNFTF